MSTVPPADPFKDFFARFPEFRALLERLRVSEARYRTLVENQVELVCRWRPDTILTYVNEAFCRYHGRSEEELLGTRFLDLIPENQQPYMLSHIQQLLAEKQTAYGEFHSPAANGSIRWHRWSDTPLLDSGGQVVEMQSVGMDITSLKRSQEALLESEERYRHLACHDWLTNLPNRTLLLDRLSQALSHCRRLNQPLAVFFADLDRFKQINDSLGSGFGDQILCELVHRLRKLPRQSDILARLNSDEFVLVCEDLGDLDSLRKMAQRLLHIFKEPIYLSGHTFHVSASIGVACFQQGEDDAETLLRQADIAMYEAKQRGGNGYKFFSREMQTSLEETFLLEKRMRVALENRDFFLHYQPQIDLNSGKIAGVEALARWGKSPEDRISPEVFIKIAEDTGLIHPLGDYLLEEACAQNFRWQRDGMPPIRVSVNISAKRFARPDFVDNIFRILERTGLEPQWLELEITESTIMDNVMEAIAIMKHLQDAGVKFAIDDFGTGYSSLNYLRQLSLSKLKIDRSFMAGVPGNHDNEKLVTSILALARGFDLQTVAEGIETCHQLAYLRQLDCRLGQGFYFSPAVAPEIIPHLNFTHLV
jgi:diguanylate cyclase (GGDEF)-like protein/PAS domain S-box-containing protein